jgi:outer membrane receptor for ferrienterochelin and colicins
VETLVIPREEIERAAVRNLPQLLRTLPGTSATNLDDTLASDNLRLTLRGLQLNEGYGLILVDGQRVHGGLGAHGDYGISLNQIPLSMIERIEVVRGASSGL